jgi:hypothetical protein
MAWSSGSFADNAAGRLITLLDAVLPANGHWSIYDAAAAANAKVYKCVDAGENCLFYVLVDNNYAGYAIIQLWEDWNAGAHTGVGASLTVVGTSTSLKITIGAGGYGISVRDHHFIFQDYVGSRGAYVGQPRRKDVSKNIVVFCGSGGTPAANPLGQAGIAAGVAWGTLFDELGNKVAVGFSGSTGGSTFIVKTITGELELRETSLTNLTTGFIMGEMEGVASYATGGAAGIVTGDTCVIDGIIWGAIYSTNLSFVEQA